MKKLAVRWSRNRAVGTWRKPPQVQRPNIHNAQAKSLPCEMISSCLLSKYPYTWSWVFHLLKTMSRNDEVPNRGLCCRACVKKALMISDFWQRSSEVGIFRSLQSRFSSDICRRFKASLFSINSSEKAHEKSLIVQYHRHLCIYQPA